MQACFGRQVAKIWLLQLRQIGKDCEVVKTMPEVPRKPKLRMHQIIQLKRKTANYSIPEEAQSVRSQKHQENFPIQPIPSFLLWLFAIVEEIVKAVYAK
jgi:hypothetical protein